MHIAAMNPNVLSPEDGENNLLEQPYIKDSERTIADLVKESVQKFGENIQIVRYSRFAVNS
jgi:translation elongation factor EF-Ts